MSNLEYSLSHWSDPENEWLKWGRGTGFAIDELTGPSFRGLHESLLLISPYFQNGKYTGVDTKRKSSISGLTENACHSFKPRFKMVFFFFFFFLWLDNLWNQKRRQIFSSFPIWFWYSREKKWVLVPNWWWVRLWRTNARVSFFIDFSQWRLAQYMDGIVIGTYWGTGI